MTRLEIAARILAGWAANPNVSGKNEEAAAVALSLADALLTAAGETPGDQYAAGFRAAVDRAAKVAESVPYVGGVKGDVAWREACDAIRALAPAAPMDAAPAPPVAPVKFDFAGRAGEWARDGWDALHRGDELRVTIMLCPGEDAGELAARMIASVGRGP